MKSAPIVMSDSPEAAKLRTVTGWVSRLGHFYGDDERIARYDGCTHRPCETEGCGKPTEKHWIYCDDCREKRDLERYWKRPAAPWDGSQMIFAEGNDQYYSDLESFLDDFAGDDIKPEDMRPMLCEPNIAREVESDYWQDEMAEDGELPGELEAALEVLNKVIREGKFALSWSAGKTRLDLTASGVTT